MRLAAALWAFAFAVPPAFGQARYDDSAWRDLWRRIDRGIEVESLLRPAPAAVQQSRKRPPELPPVGGFVRDPNVTLQASRKPPPARPAGHRPALRRELVRQIACELGMSPALALALIEQESGFQPPIRGLAGEIGAAQILPGTAAIYGLDTEQLHSDFAYNVRAGLSILKGLLEETGSEAEALRAYNGGRGWRTLSPEAQQAVQRYAEQVLARKAGYAAIGCTPPASVN